MSDENKPKHPGGRIPQAKVQRPHEVQALINKIMEKLEEPLKIQARTPEELIDKAYLILTIVQDIHVENLRVVSARNVIINTTNNGKQRFLPVGLPPEDLAYLNTLVNSQAALIKSLKTDSEESKNKIKSMQDLVDKFHTGFQVYSPEEIEKINLEKAKSGNSEPI